MSTSRPAPPPERGTLTVADNGADVVLSVVDVDGWTLRVVLSPDAAARQLAAAARRARKGAI